MGYKVKYEAFLDQTEIIYVPRKPEKPTIGDWIGIIFSILLVLIFFFGGVFASSYLYLGHIDFSFCMRSFLVILGYAGCVFVVGFLWFVADQ